MLIVGMVIIWVIMPHHYNVLQLLVITRNAGLLLLKLDDFLDGEKALPKGSNLWYNERKGNSVLVWVEYARNDIEFVPMN